MSYSPARIDETPKPAADPAAEAARKEAPTPSWFAEGAVDPDAAAARYRERLARHAEMQREENEQLEDYRRKLDEKFAMAKRLYDRPVNDNPQEISLRSPAAPSPALAAASHDPALARTLELHAGLTAAAGRIPMGSSAAEPMLRPRRPTVPLAEIEKRKKRYVPNTKEIRARKPPKRSRPSLAFYATAAALAVVIGAGAGYGLANRVNMLAFTQDGFARAQSWAQALLNKAAPAKEQVAVASSGSANFSKPITSARLAVNDVRGQLNSMIPLVLSATPASADQPLDLEITGLPQSAYLTAGHQKEDGSWVVKAPEIADLKLVVPQSETPKINLEVAAVDQSSGLMAAPAQRMSVELSDVKITPASAPPDGQPDPQGLKPAADAAVATAVPAAIAPPSGPGADLLARADGLMNQGDILSARQYYLQASAAGNPRGTLGVARSYDPKVFAEMKIEGLQPDAAKAAEWYKKAQAQGLTAQQ